MRLTEILRRLLCIAALFASFLILGAPGGGGGGGFGGGSGGGGGFGGNSGGLRTFSINSDPIQKIAGPLFLIALVGFFVWLLYRPDFAKERSSERATNHLPAATVRLTVVILIEGNVQKHIAFFDRLLAKARFDLPGARTSVFRRLLTHVWSARLVSGYVQTHHYKNAEQAAERTKSLTTRQIERMNRYATAPDASESRAVVGFTLITTPEFADRSLCGKGKEKVWQTWRNLGEISPASLDSFYLFYAPGTGDTLPREEAEQILMDLEAMGSGLAPTGK